MKLDETVCKLIAVQRWQTRAICSPIGIIPDEDWITAAGTYDYYEPSTVETIQIDRMHCLFTVGFEARPPIRWILRVTVTLRLARGEKEETWFLGETTPLRV